jgi:hypothetical protein
MCRVLCDTITARLARFPIKLHHYRLGLGLAMEVHQRLESLVLLFC